MRYTALFLFFTSDRGKNFARKGMGNKQVKNLPQFGSDLILFILRALHFKYHIGFKLTAENIVVTIGIFPLQPYHHGYLGNIARVKVTYVFLRYYTV